MSGHHHRREGWTYGPRPRGLCRACLIERTVDTHGLLVTHRWRHTSPQGGQRCPGSREKPMPDDVANPVNPADRCATCRHERWRHRTIRPGEHECTEYAVVPDCACEGVFVEPTPASLLLEHLTRFGHAMTAFRTQANAVIQAAAQLHATLRDGGYLDDSPETQGAADINPEVAREAAVEQLSQALNIPQDAITGPTPDGIPDSWVTVAGRANGKTSAGTPRPPR